MTNNRISAKSNARSATVEPCVFAFGEWEQMTDIDDLLNRIDWGLVSMSLEFSMQRFREYNYKDGWPNDHKKAYEFQNQQIESARKAKNDIAKLARLLKVTNERL